MVQDVFSINTSYQTTIEVKKSKFISTLVEYDDFNTTIQSLANQHPKARHIIYAYRYLNNLNQIIENSSDDKEPKGVAGKPTLTVMQGAKLINCAIISVRYFGGIKLGMGGMVRAYSDSANEVIKSANLFEFEILSTKTITIPYSQLSYIEYIFKNLNIQIIEKTFDSTVKLTIQGTKQNLTQALKKLQY